MKNKIFFSLILFTGFTFIFSAYAQEGYRKGYWREKLHSQRQTEQTQHIVTKLTIQPDGWSGVGAYEIVEFTCVPTWSDGKADPDCERLGSLPTWSVEGYGRIEDPTAKKKEINTQTLHGGFVKRNSSKWRAWTGRKSILWKSGHGPGTGILKVTYGGVSTQVALEGKEPTKKAMGVDYFSSWKLPRTTIWSKQKFVNRTLKQWEKHYAAKIEEADRLSESLESYIRKWLKGEVPAKLPSGLLPPSIENEKTRDWTLCQPEKVTPEEQWYCRPANEIPEDFSKLYFLSPDNHCTYLKIMCLAPFGSRLVIEGDFPHCRFMDYQIMPPFDPRVPCTGGMGAPEVPIVDVDIEPDNGHVNPFRVGADRRAKKRHYHVYFNLARGNAVELNPESHVPPRFRAPGNTRVGGPFTYTGSYGLGTIIPNLIWLRYYAPDHGTGPLAGVPLPKARLELSTGEKFWLKCDFSNMVRRQNVAVPGFITPPKDPASYIGHTFGWLKMFGIWLVHAEGIGLVTTKPWGKLPKEWVARPIRKADREHFRRGPEMPPPGNYECTASCCNYINYLVRPISLGKGKVIVLTGRLPKTPRTRNGETVMTKAECRYWSIARTANSPDKVFPCILYGCLMDDEIVLDTQRRYAIVYSRKEDRPSNAIKAAGVTWQDWGPASMQVMNIRWLSVIREWHLPMYAPDEKNLPWVKTAWSQKNYDQNLVGRNKPGFLGPYHPVIHYMTTEEFEALGSSVKPDSVPAWSGEDVAERTSGQDQSRWSRMLATGFLR